MSVNALNDPKVTWVKSSPPKESAYQIWRPYPIWFLNNEDLKKNTFHAACVRKSTEWPRGHQGQKWPSQGRCLPYIKAIPQRVLNEWGPEKTLTFCVTDGKTHGRTHAHTHARTHGQPGNIMPPALRRRHKNKKISCGCYGGGSPKNGGRDTCHNIPSMSIHCEVEVVLAIWG